MPTRISLDPRVFAAANGLEVTTWSGIPIGEVAAAIDILSRSRPGMHITVTHQGVTVKHSPGMTREEFIAQWRAKEQESRVKVP